MNPDCQGGKRPPVNESKVCWEVCWIKLQYCPISLGKSLWVCICTERRESTWHFIFELIACCPVVLPAASRLSEKLAFAFSLFLLKINQQEKSDYTQERFMKLVRIPFFFKFILKITVLRFFFFLSKVPKAAKMYRGNREPCLRITSLLGSKQLKRLSLGIWLDPAQNWKSVDDAK